MAKDEDIRAAQERAIAVFEKRPEMGMSTIGGTAEVSEGLRSVYTESGREFIADMPTTIGGGGDDPTPGYYSRAGLANCVAIGIKMTATRMGVTLRNIRVDVEMDFDDSAVLGVRRNKAAPLETRVKVNLDSDADLSTLEALVAEAMNADPYFLALRDPQNVELTVEAS